MQDVRSAVRPRHSFTHGAAVLAHIGMGRQGCFVLFLIVILGEIHNGSRAVVGFAVKA